MKRLDDTTTGWAGFRAADDAVGSRHGSGQPLPSPLQQVTADNCLACHSKVNDSWMVGAHGNAATDEKFLAAWKRRNDPSCMLPCTGYDKVAQTWQTEGVTCVACHPLNTNHPKEPIQVDRTGNCGTAHGDLF
jgi:hypothetical protein